MTPENAETQSWVTKTVWQRIPGRRACNSETPTITVQSIPGNDHLPLSVLFTPLTAKFLYSIDGVVTCC